MPGPSLHSSHASTAEFMTRLSRLLAMAVSGAEGWKSRGMVKGPGIPAPSGRYRVGCVDLMHQLEGDERGLLVRLHYPTEATPEAGYTYSSWYPHLRYIQGYMEFEKIKFAGALSKIISMFTDPQMPALEGAPLHRAEDRRRVIVFSHGLGGMRTCYSATACDLASHGYVVACVEHRDESACVTLQRIPKPGGKEGELEDFWLKFYHVKDGDKEFPLRNRQVKQRADEVKKTLDILTLLNQGAEIKDMLGGNYDFKQFEGHIDVSAAALMGHSFGGGTTVQTLAEDSRFKCGLALDCWMVPIHRDFYNDKSRITQPLYFICTHNFQWNQNVERMMLLTQPPDANGMTPRRVLTLNGTHHFNQCDIPFVAPRTLVRMGITGSSLDSETAHQVNMDICHAFLKRHFLEDPAYQQTIPNLDGTEGHSEHIIFGTNLDLSEPAPNSHL